MTDIELIHKFRENRDNSALVELINRHTGIYIAIAENFYTKFPKIQIQDIKEDRMFNIYKWIESYKEDKGMQLGTYIGERTKYLCMDIIRKTPDKVQVTEENEPLSSDDVASNASTDDMVSEAESKAITSDDERFVEIFKMRHPTQGKPITWRSIGPMLGITYERARQIYKENIDSVKNHLTT